YLHSSPTRRSSDLHGARVSSVRLKPCRELPVRRDPIDAQSPVAGARNALFAVHAEHPIGLRMRWVPLERLELGNEPLVGIDDLAFANVAIARGNIVYLTALGTFLAVPTIVAALIFAPAPRADHAEASAPVVSRNWPELRLEKLAKDIEAIAVFVGFVVEIILVAAKFVDVMAIGALDLDRVAIPSTAGRLHDRLKQIAIWR